jgi:predicted oxidoreductase
VPLPQRPLGSSGVLITKTGFGACAIGGGGWAFGWGPQDDAVSLATMRHALELGVNWTDTAAVYGLGHSEEVVGRPAARTDAIRAPNGLHQVCFAATREIPGFASTGFMLRSPCGGRLSYRRE